MRIPDHDVTTEEVKSWQGLHLLHFAGSSCSQKVRILLNEKGIPWESHPVDLPRNAHATPWFLGINPRGVVPVLVHDGVVHVESNDIMAYLDAEVPSEAEPYFPRDEAERRIVDESLALEDALHMALRTVTMGFLAPGSLVKKSPKVLDAYEKAGAADASRAKEVAWWRAFAEQGVTKEDASVAFRDFESAFEELEKRLVDRPWLIGERISVLEIAWVISVHRLVMARYPLERHPRLAAWYAKLLERPAFVREMKPKGIVGAAFPFFGWLRAVTGRSLLDVVEGGARV